VNPDALSERRAIDRIPRASLGAPLIPTSTGHAALAQPEAPTWPS
jgi:hypothetical protein